MHFSMGLYSGTDKVIRNNSEYEISVNHHDGKGALWGYFDTELEVLEFIQEEMRKEGESNG